MKTVLGVFRVMGSILVRVGSIERAQRGADEVFSYAESYLERDAAVPLSLSLPFQRGAYPAQTMRPYFAGLLPEGPTREAALSQLGIPEDDYLALLAAIGMDCIGDVVVLPETEIGVGSSMPWDSGSFAPLGADDVKATLADLSTLAWSSGQSRLSLAGTQGKVGLTHMPSCPMNEGWLRPLGGAASTHILKTSNLSRIAEFEAICMGAAHGCGLRAAKLDVLSFGRPVACVERFDRNTTVIDGIVHVMRLHQEDLAQAFGIASRAKYHELEGGSYAAIARLLERRSKDPLSDVEELARFAVFSYLVGNCDNHLKNLSIIHEGSSIRLAPAYDIVCTTFFERFSREMGMRLGATRMIDDVVPDDFGLLAKDLGMSAKGMRRICSELVELLPLALHEAGAGGSSACESLPYSAEDVIDDAKQRIAIASSFSHRA